MSLLLNGVNLDDPAGRWYVLATSRVRNPPAVVVNDLVVPGMHGILPSSDRTFGPGSVVLTLRIRGGTYAQTMANYVTLSRTIETSFLVSRTLLDNEINQQAWVYLASIGDLEPNFRRMLTCTLTLSIPRSFWEDSVETTVDLGTGSGRIEPAALAGGSAPIVDPIFVAGGNGATTDFKVTDAATSRYFRVVGNVPTSQAIRIEPDTASAWLVDPANPWTGGTDASGLLTVGPGQFLLSRGMAFNIVKTGTTNTQLRARRAYL